MLHSAGMEKPIGRARQDALFLGTPQRGRNELGVGDEACHPSVPSEPVRPIPATGASAGAPIANSAAFLPARLTVAGDPIRLDRFLLARGPAAGLGRRRLGALMAGGGVRVNGTPARKGTIVREGAVVAAASVTAPGTVVEAGMIWSGRPAAAARPLSDQNRSWFAKGVDVYIGYTEKYLRGAKVTP